MSNDKLWKAAREGKTAEVSRLLETPEGLAGLEYEVCAAAALPSHPTPHLPTPPFARPPRRSAKACAPAPRVAVAAGRRAGSGVTRLMPCGGGGGGHAAQWCGGVVWG